MTAAAVRAGGGERGALAVALAAHVGLFALLSLSWNREPPPAWPQPAPIEVSLVDKVAPDATAPPSPVPPAPSVAPDVGTPDAAPPPAPVAAPRPEPVKPAPQAKPAPEPKPAPAQRPAAASAPEPVKPTLAKPTPAKTAPAKPAPANPAAKPSATAATRPAATPKSSRLAGLGQELAAGAKADAHAAKPRGARLGDNFLKGLAPDAPARTASDAAPAARAGPYPTASIVGAIARQIQPCADRQVDPGPGANRITTTLNIRLNADGTLAATPRMVRQSGVDDGNERYAQRVADLGVAAFKGCTPLKLPAEYYQTATGGWSNINYQWKLR